MTNIKDTLAEAVTSLVARATQAGHAPPPDIAEGLRDLGLLFDREWVIVRKEGPVQWWSDEAMDWVDYEDATRYSDIDREDVGDTHFGNWVEVPRP